MDSKQKYLEESNRVLVLKKALSQLGLMPHAEAKQVVEQFERITNVLKKILLLAHLYMIVIISQNT